MKEHDLFLVDDRIVPEMPRVLGKSWLSAKKSPIPVTLVFIALLIAVNLRGVRESLIANVGATLIEMTGLIIIIVVAALVIGGGGGDLSRLTTFSPDVPPLL